MSAQTGHQAARARFDLLYSSRRYAEALDVVRDALAHSPDDAELLVDAARAASLLGDLSEARSHVEQAISADHGNVRALLMGSAIARAQSRTNDAVGLAQRGVALSPQFAGGYVQLAYSHLLRGQSGDLAAGRAAADRALELAPDDVDVLSDVAEFYVVVGDHKPALALIERGLALAPQHARLLTQRIEITRDHEEALSAVKGVLADDPLNIDARTQLHARAWHLLNAPARTAATMTIYGLLIGSWLWADGRIASATILTILLTALGVFSVIRTVRSVSVAKADYRQSLRDGGSASWVGLVLSVVAVVLWLAFAVGSLTLSNAAVVPFLIWLGAATLVAGSVAIFLLLVGEMRAAGRAGMLHPDSQSFDYFVYVATVGQRKTRLFTLVIVVVSALLVVVTVQGAALGVALLGIAAAWLGTGTARSWMLAKAGGWANRDRTSRVWNIATIVIVAALGVAALVWAPRAVDTDGAFYGSETASTSTLSVSPIDSRDVYDSWL